jgi:hypothetical protein
MDIAYIYTNGEDTKVFGSELTQLDHDNLTENDYYLTASIHTVELIRKLCNVENKERHQIIDKLFKHI